MGCFKNGTELKTKFTEFTGKKRGWLKMRACTCMAQIASHLHPSIQISYVCSWSVLEEVTITSRLAGTTVCINLCREMCWL